MRDEVRDNVKAVHFSYTFYKSGYFEVSILKDLQGRKTNRKALIFDVRSTCSQGKKIRRSRGTCDENKHTVTPSFYYIFCSVLFMAVNCAKFEKIWKLLTSFSRECITSRGHVTLFATFKSETCPRSRQLNSKNN